MSYPRAGQKLQTRDGETLSILYVGVQVFASARPGIDYPRGFALASLAPTALGWSAR